MSNKDLPTSAPAPSNMSRQRMVISPSPPPSTILQELKSMSPWTRLALRQARRMTEMAERILGLRESPVEWAEDVSDNERQHVPTCNQVTNRTRTHNYPDHSLTPTNQQNLHRQECIVVCARSNDASITTPRERMAVDRSHQRITETHIEGIQPWLWTNDLDQQLVAPIRQYQCLQDQSATTDSGPNTPSTEEWLGQSIPNNQRSATPLGRNIIPASRTTPGTFPDLSGKKQVSKMLRDESPTSSVRKAN
jgi:hypothetical protein